MARTSAPVPRRDVEGFAVATRPPTSTGSWGFLLDSMRRRPVGRAILTGLTTLLFVAGVGMFAYPLATDIYVENFTQKTLADEFERVVVDVTDITEWEENVAAAGQGAALLKIAIPALDVETLIVEGVSPAALRAGAGHYPTTPLPGQEGNVAIAGHRTTYGRPFNRVDELNIGDVIWLVTPIGDYRYELTRNPYPTQPSDWTVVEQPNADGTPTESGIQPGDKWLTLTTCHPKGSAAQRLIVRAELVEELPPGSYDAQKASTEAAA